MNMRIVRKPEAVLAMLVALALCGCSPDGPALRQSFVESDLVTFTVKGAQQHRFNMLTWQSVYSPDPCVFVVCDDDMSDYYILRCSRTPREVGESVKCDVEWTTYSNLRKKKDVEFSLVKADWTSGTLWLWSSSELIGAAVVAVE